MCALTEIPSDSCGSIVVGQGVLQQRKDLSCIGTVDFGFLEKFDLIRHIGIDVLCKLYNLLVIPRLLASKLVAGEAEDL